MAPPPARRWLERKDIDHLTVVRCTVRKLDVEDKVRLIADQISGLVDMGRRQLVLDLSGVLFISSYALGKLVMLNKKFQAVNGRLALCLSRQGAEAFEKTQLHQLLHIYGAEEEAVESFAILDREDLGEVTVLRFRSTLLTQGDIGFLMEQLGGLVADSGRHRLVLNCHKLDSRSSPALTELAGRIKEKIPSLGGEVVCCQAVPEIAEGLPQAFLEVYDTEQEAVESFQR